MQKRLLVVAASVLSAGILSAFISAPLVSGRCSEEFVGTYAAVAPATTKLVLAREAVGVVGIPSELLEAPSERFHGLFAPFLRRSTCVLPLRESVAPFPRAWVFARSRAVGPFLVLTDVDGTWELASAAHVIHRRTLDVSFGPWS